MSISMLTRSKTYLSLVILMGMTSCCRPGPTCYVDGDPINIPGYWSAPIAKKMTGDDAACFLWWRALDDPLLTGLIEQAPCRNEDVLLATTESKEKALQAANVAAADIAKSYIELRALQQRRQILQANIQAQRQIVILNQGLTNSGNISSIEQNENRKALDALHLQAADVELALRKAVFHLSTLLGYIPGGLEEAFCAPKNLPCLPPCVPIGCPIELIQRHPLVRDARKGYTMSGSCQALYNYKKTVLNVFEAAENALAAFFYAEKKYALVINSRSLKAETYQLTKDLYVRGLKDDRELLLVNQDLFAAEDALLQSHTELLNAYIDLYQALSAGWQH